MWVVLVGTLLGLQMQTKRRIAIISKIVLWCLQWSACFFEQFDCGEC